MAELRNPTGHIRILTCAQASLAPLAAEQESPPVIMPVPRPSRLGGQATSESRAQHNPALDCGGLSASRQWQDRPARSAFALLAIYGLRPSEALGLSWSDIHPAPGAADLAASLSRPTCRPSLTGTGCSGHWNPRTDAGMHEQVFSDRHPEAGRSYPRCVISPPSGRGCTLPLWSAPWLARWFPDGLPPGGYFVREPFPASMGNVIRGERDGGAA